VVAWCAVFGIGVGDCVEHDDALCYSVRVQASSTEGSQLRSFFVPVELQRRGFQHKPIFAELAGRGFALVNAGAVLVQPWCRWHGISTYLDCVAYADRSARSLPQGKDLNLTHVTPGRFYSAAIVFFAQAMLDNIAVWLCDALPLSVKGGDRHFLSSQFTRELKKKQGSSHALLEKHKAFVKEVNTYRQVWIHTLAGGAMPITDTNPFINPGTDDKFLRVPIDPAIQIGDENYQERIGQCAARNGGRYLYEISEFTGRIFESASTFYLDWLRFALDVCPPPS